MTRAVAILRRWNAVTRRPSLLVTYSPYACLARREGVAVEEIEMPERRFLEAVLRRVRPAGLVVDTFPRGIVGELAEMAQWLECPAVLVERYLNPSYLERFRVAEFVEQHYRLVVRLGDALPPQALTRCSVDVPPVTVRAAWELPPAAARSGWLFVDWGEGSGPYVAAASETARRRGKSFEVLRPAACYPVVERLGAAELAIGAGGYNFFHEAALTRTPAVFLPQRRLYDDQFGRTAAAAQARTPEELRALLEGPPPALLPAHEGEGASAVVEILSADFTDYAESASSA